METNIDFLIHAIERVPDTEAVNPRIGLRQLRERCAEALDAMSYISIFSNEQQQLQSTIWVIDSITAEESGFDRWLLFVLRTKKMACARLLRKFAARTQTPIAA
jgi:hypothetical protein